MIPPRGSLRGGRARVRSLVTPVEDDLAINDRLFNDHLMNFVWGNLKGISVHNDDVREHSDSDTTNSICHAFLTSGV
jgi:hypothetical protein